MNIKCIFCGSDSRANDNLYFHRFVECPVCGRYYYQTKLYDHVINKYKNELSFALYHIGHKKISKDDKFFCYIGDDKNYDSVNEDYPWNHRITENELKIIKRITFSDMITKVLSGFAEQAKYPGNYFDLSIEALKSALFIRRYDESGEELTDQKITAQIREIMDYLEDTHYIEDTYDENGYRIMIKPEGWKRIEDIQLEDSNNKNVFVSMPFNDKTNDIRERIKTAIINAEYSPEFIDEIIHNRQIVPEMFRLIGECRFLILDITEPNYGAYYEAGYAMGLGKEVIITCSKETFHKKIENEKQKKNEKIIEPHFDIAQKQILVWDNLDDLEVKLEEWIKFIIG